MKTLFTIVVMTILSTSLSAQDQVFEEAMTVAADAICDCVDQNFAIDQEAQDELIKMMEFESQDDMNEYLASLPQEKQLKVMEAAMQLQKIEETSFNDCINKMGSKLVPYEQDLAEANYSEADFQQGIVDQLAKGEDCKFTYLLLKSSMQAQPSTEPSKIEQKTEDPRYGGGGN